MTGRADLSCLVLMLKAPARSKRRIAATHGAQAAAALAERLTACALEDLAAWPGQTRVAFGDVSDGEWLRTAGHRVAGLPQGSGNLGERLERVSERLRTAGCDRQLFIGTDCPELDGDYLAAADAALRDHDVVLGAAEDGGVVLMGTRAGWPPLAPLPWSTARLGAALEHACRAAHLDVAQLAPRADIDALADLAVVVPRLRPDQRPARRALCRWADGAAERLLAR